MNQPNLIETADAVNRMIDEARAGIAAGAAVDLSPIAEATGRIHAAVSDDNAPGSVAERFTLLSRLNAILTQLAALEDELTAAQQRQSAQ